MNIHAKPGYDACELFFDPALWWPKGRALRRLAQKLLGFRTCSTWYLLIQRSSKAAMVWLVVSLAAGRCSSVTGRDHQRPRFP